MKLAARMVGFLMIGILLLLGMDAYLSVKRQSAQYRADMERDARLLGDALKSLVEDIWRTRGKEQAVESIRQANRQEHAVEIRWVSQQEIGQLLGKNNGKTALAGTPTSFIAAGNDGRQRMFTYVAVSDSEPETGCLELSEPMSLLRQYNHAIMFKTAVLGGTIFAISGGAVVLLGVWLVGRPLHRLSDKARRIGEGDLSGPLKMHRRDELSDLAATMNEMCSHLAESQERLRQEQQKRIETLEQLRHADRLRTVGKLAAGVAHELGTPLNTISIRSTMIAQDPDASSNCKRNATIVRTQTERLSKIVQQLLAYARPRSLQKSANDLHAVLQQTLEFLKPLAASRSVSFHVGTAIGPAIAIVDSDQLQQVLTNLIMNGIQAMPGGGCLTVEMQREHSEPPAGHEAKPGDYFCISIRDQGEGIAARNMKHIFDPFFTTKDVGQGSGLGLSIAYGIMEEHNGWIVVTSELRQGSCFRVYLPVPKTSESQDSGAADKQSE